MQVCSQGYKTFQGSHQILSIKQQHPLEVHDRQGNVTEQIFTDIQATEYM